MPAPDLLRGERDGVDPDHLAQGDKLVAVVDPRTESSWFNREGGDSVHRSEAPVLDRSTQISRPQARRGAAGFPTYRLPDRAAQQNTANPYEGADHHDQHEFGNGGG